MAVKLGELGTVLAEGERDGGATLMDADAVLVVLTSGCAALFDGEVVANELGDG